MDESINCVFCTFFSCVFALFFPVAFFSPSRPQALGSHDEYLAAMAQNQDKLVVVKFFDQFCRACDEIRPRFEEMSRSQSSEDAAFFELEVRSKDRSQVVDETESQVVGHPEIQIVGHTRVRIVHGQSDRS